MSQELLSIVSPEGEFLADPNVSTPRDVVAAYRSRRGRPATRLVLVSNGKVGAMEVLGSAADQLETPLRVVRLEHVDRPPMSTQDGTPSLGLVYGAALDEADDTQVVGLSGVGD